MASKSAELLLKIKTAGEESLDRVSDAIDAVGKAGMIAFTALTAIVVKSISAYADAEQASNSLSRAMVNAGVYSSALKQKYDEQAQALAKLTTFEDDQITAAQAALQMQLKELEITPQLIKATADLAAAKKIDLVTAAEMVGKSIGTSTNALARQGIELSTTTDKTQRMTEVMAGLNSQFGGQAEAAAQGLGVLKQLEHSVGNLFEALGERLAPAVNLVAGWLNKLASDTSSTMSVIDAFASVIGFIAHEAVVVAGAVNVLGQSIGTGLATAFHAVKAAASGNFAEAVQITKDGLALIKADAIANTEQTNQRLLELDAAFQQQKRDKYAQEDIDLVASLERKREIKMTAELDEQNRLLEQDIAGQQLALQMIDANEQQKLAALIAWNDKKLAAAGTAEEKNALLKQKYALQDQQQQAKIKEMDRIADEKMVQNRAATLSIIAGMQNSSNKSLAAIGKAAAVTQIAIQTPVAIAQALGSAPPPFNFVLAGLVGAAMASQAADLAGVQLADGGIVKASPGGTLATIGEGGQDEMVVPLDRASEFGFGGGGGGNNITIVVNGGLMGSESEAYEFAKSIDRELLKLRQNNESVSFDSRVV